MNNISAYTIINDSKKAVADLEFKLQYSKNLKKDQKQIDTINVMIGSYEAMLENQYYTDAFETVIFAYLRAELMHNEAYKKPPRLQIILNKILADIHSGPGAMKSEIKSILSCYDVIDTIESKSTQFQDFTQVLNEFINHTKNKIRWTKKQPKN